MEGSCRRIGSTAVHVGVNDMDYKRYLAQSDEWKEREIVLCGLDIVSFGVIDYLAQNGKKVRGIIEKTCKEKTTIWGIAMYPESFLEDEIFSDCFFMITAFKEKHRRKYANQLEKLYGKERFLVVASEEEVRIDIAGRCNLRCPSCQVANHCRDDFSYCNRGFMEISLLQQILYKVKKEFLNLPAVYLFTLGEPVLHPKIAEAIQCVHKEGFMAVVSTNLSYKKDLEAFMRAEPDVLKISLSGFTQEIYETTHCGGDIELVKENMKKVAELIQTYHLKTKVMVGYHVYKNNQGEEMEQMKRLCQELGFLFQPVPAMYFNMLKRTGYTEFTEEDKKFIRSYYENAEEILTVPSPKYPEGECRNYRDKLFIDYDGKVMLCELFHREGIYKSYLDTSYEEIQNWRKQHFICQRCKEYGQYLR